MKKIMPTKFLATIATTLLLAALTAPVSAMPILSGCGDSMSAGGTDCTLGELFGGGSITTQGLRFRDWTLNAGLSSITSGFDRILVTEGAGSDMSTTVLELTASGAPLEVISPTVNTSADLIFSYLVERVDATPGISGAGLSILDYNASGTGSGIIADTLLCNPLLGLPCNSIAASLLALTPSLTSASSVINSETAVLAEASIFVQAGAGANSNASLSRLALQWSQSTGVPEPATLALALFGLLGLQARRKAA